MLSNLTSNKFFLLALKIWLWKGNENSWKSSGPNEHILSPRGKLNLEKKHFFATKMMTNSLPDLWMRAKIIKLNRTEIIPIQK